MFDPDILGWSAAAFLTFAQTVLTPALGFLFLYLMRLPLTKLSFVPESAKYKPPRWVLPLFTAPGPSSPSSAPSQCMFSARIYVSLISAPRSNRNTCTLPARLRRVTRRSPTLPSR